jgi:hypothetical protein
MLSRELPKHSIAIQLRIKVDGDNNNNKLVFENSASGHKTEFNLAEGCIFSLRASLSNLVTKALYQ